MDKNDKKFLIFVVITIMIAVVILGQWYLSYEYEIIITQVELVPLLIIGITGYILCWAAKEAMKSSRNEKTKRKTGNNDPGDTLPSIILIFSGIAFIIIGLSGHPQVELVPLLIIGIGFILLGILLIIPDKCLDTWFKKDGMKQ